MSSARSNMDAVILPTGKVLAWAEPPRMGWPARPASRRTSSTLQAGTWSPAGAATYPRMYHSVALLLPGRHGVDGRVESGSRHLRKAHGDLLARLPLHHRQRGPHGAGPAAHHLGRAHPGRLRRAVHGEDRPTPPRSPRWCSSGRAPAPTPSTWSNGWSGSPSTGSQPTRWWSPVPPDGNIAPPGYYMLFLVNQQGVPSVATSSSWRPTPRTSHPPAQIVSPADRRDHRRREIDPLRGRRGRPGWPVLQLLLGVPHRHPGSSTAATPGQSSSRPRVDSWSPSRSRITSGRTTPARPPGSSPSRHPPTSHPPGRSSAQRLT